MIVAKFGGTSVSDWERMRRAVDIVREYVESGYSAVLAASAMGATTDRITRLIAYAEETGKASAGGGAGEGAGDDGIEFRYAEIEKVHSAAIAGIGNDALRDKTGKQVNTLLDGLRAGIDAIGAGEGCDPWRRAELLAYGELLSTAVIAGVAADSGVKCELLDSRRLLRTGSVPIGATIEWEETNAAIRGAIAADSGVMYIVQGFIASDGDGKTTIFSRGGSDYSASIYAAALDADRVEIWTDVNGVMTTDPRHISQARTVEYLSYTEAAELAYFGARVIHPSTMLPIIKKNIPMVVANANDPRGHKTTIGAASEQRGVRAIVFKQGITVVNIQSYRMLNAHGFLNKIFAVFSEFNTAVDLISTSEVSLSLTIDDDSSLGNIIEYLHTIAKVEVVTGRSIVCLVGHRLWRRAELLSEVFSTMRDIPVELISLGASDTNLSMVVADEHVLQSVERLHARFFEEK